LPKRKPPALKPWQKHREGLPPNETLRDWRVIADRYAREQGARWACNLCKRPMGVLGEKAKQMRHQPGWFALRRPAKWTTPGVKRRICLNCYMSAMQWMKEREAEGARSELPAEIIAGDEEMENE
jgi:hypothetical protein